MPFHRTRSDYILITLLFSVFFWALFFGSRIGDLHYSTNAGCEKDPAFISDINMAVYIIPFFLIYEMFIIYVFEGKPRIREINKKLLVLRFKTIVRNKLQDGIDDYHRWRTR
jgi:hypothetical protein